MVVLNMYSFFHNTLTPHSKPVLITFDSYFEAWILSDVKSNIVITTSKSLAWEKMSILEEIYLFRHTLNPRCRTFHRQDIFVAGVYVDSQNIYIKGYWLWDKGITERRRGGGGGV